MRDRDEFAAALEALGDAGGVLKVGDRVQKLDSLAHRPAGRDGFAQGLRHDAALVHGHLHDLHLIGAKRAQRPHV